MIDHLRIPVSNFAASRRFYLATLPLIGYEVEKDLADRIRFSDGVGFLYVIAVPGDERPTPRHLAFRAHNVEEIRKFYGAALAAGGRDNGAPGPRPAYDVTYFAAFVLDPDGNNIEVVIHDYRPE